MKIKKIGMQREIARHSLRDLLNNIRAGQVEELENIPVFPTLSELLNDVFCSENFSSLPQM